ncbi:hypothetical protein [Pseudoxanthomonas japonensis]|uniref:hypothetical protein n=1 Tax=Pseudoxanthomonas japonensis TaxID=69284 RepID=UPI00374A323A
MPDVSIRCAGGGGEAFCFAVEPPSFARAPRWCGGKAKSLATGAESLGGKANRVVVIAESFDVEAKSRVVSLQWSAVEAFCFGGNPKSLASEAKSLVISPQCPARAPFWFDFSQ